MDTHNTIKVDDISDSNNDIMNDRRVLECQNTFATATEEEQEGSAVDSSHNDSVSEEEEDEEELPWWFPHFRGKPIFYGNIEAVGWVIEATGRAIAVMSASAFLATTWLNKVKLDAGCILEVPDGETVPPCEGRVYGFRPSSFLMVYTVGISFVSAMLMPVFGAIVDYTPHRRLMGRWFSVILSLFLIPTIFVMELPWEVVAASFVIMTATSWGETVVSNAYIPELTDDETILNYFTTVFVIIPFGSVVMFLMMVVGISYAFQIHTDDGKVAKFAQTSSLLVSIVCLGIAWGYFLKQRPPKNQMQPGKNIYTEGFKQIYHTSVDIYQNYHALKWFYIANAFGEAGFLAVATITLNYQIDVLLFSSIESGTAVFITLISTLPGAVFGYWITRTINPIKSTIVTTILMITLTGVYAGILVGPGQQIEVYVLMLGIGIASGWKWTCDKMLAAFLIPKGQEAELMAFHSSSSNILSWLPPVIFTAMNEAHVNQRIGLAVVNIYFVISIGCYLMMGSYKAALARVDRLPAAKTTSTLEQELVHSKQGETNMEEGSYSNNASSVPRKVC